MSPGGWVGMQLGHVVVAPANSNVLEVQEVAIPDPGPHQVVVRQIASGICHSQLHQLRRARQTPLLVGHESSGIVIAVGSAVRHVQQDDHVVLTWMPRRSSGDARQPEPARLALPDGSTATCPQGIFTWSDVTIADAHYVVKVPADTPMVEAAIIGCAVMTGAGAVRNTAAVKPGDSVAVIGVGGVGLSAVAAARMAGAQPIVAVDLSDSKLRLAHDFGATHLVNGRQCDPVEEIRSLTRSDTEYTYGGEAVSGVDFAFDCIGMPTTMGQAVAMARSGTFGGKPGGTAVLVGAPTDTFELDARDMLVNEKRFIGSLGGSSTPDRDVPDFLEWYSSGAFDVGRLVTDRFQLADINVAVEALASGAIRGRAVLMFGNDGS